MQNIYRVLGACISWELYTTVQSRGTIPDLPPGTWLPSLWVFQGSGGAAAPSGGLGGPAPGKIVHRLVLFMHP